MATYLPRMISLTLMGDEYSSLIVPALISRLISPKVSRGRYRYSLLASEGHIPKDGANVRAVRNTRYFNPLPPRSWLVSMGSSAVVYARPHSNRKAISRNQAIGE